eukprot:scaffold249186_cov99-Cyclotella_meneghiniana.AAC.1
MITRQFGGSVADNFVVNSIGDPPISDGLINKKFEDEVAFKALLKTDQAGAFDGTAEKGDG